FAKDAFHRRVVHQEARAVRDETWGTKAAAWYELQVPANGETTLRMRLTSETQARVEDFGPEVDHVFSVRRDEADAFYRLRRNLGLTPEEAEVVRQADAGLLWSKQYYGYVVEHWLEGDPGQPEPPPARRGRRNADWHHLYARDVISMP